LFCIEKLTVKRDFGVVFGGFWQRLLSFSVDLSRTIFDDNVNKRLDLGLKGLARRKKAKVF
jgi:hypothetical protein